MFTDIRVRVRVRLFFVVLLFIVVLFLFLIFVPTCVVRAYVRFISVYMLLLCVRVCERMRVYMCMSVYVHMLRCVCVCVCVCACARARLRACMCVCAIVRAHMCQCAYLNTGQHNIRRGDSEGDVTVHVVGVGQSCATLQLNTCRQCGVRTTRCG